MNIAILISGGGTTAQAVLQSSRHGKLENIVNPVVVIASDPNVSGIQKAALFGVSVEVVTRYAYKNQEEFGEELLKVLHKYKVTLISQNGWLPLTPKNVIEHYKKKIINQHPGPLDPGRPDFGGKGMFGARVTCARVIYSMLAKEQHPWTEAVTHYVTEDFDKGTLIRIKRLNFSILEKNISVATIEQNKELQLFIKKKTQDIQQTLLPLEHENVIDTLVDFVKGSVPEMKRNDQLIPQENTSLLLQAKELAISFFPNG